METNKETLAHISQFYPAAITSLPKGWRFINFGEKICKNDKFWTDLSGRGLFDNVFSVGKIYHDAYLPIVRRIRSQKVREKPLDLNDYNVGDQFLARDGTVLVMIKKGRSGALFDFATINGGEYGSRDRYSDGFAAHSPKREQSHDVVSFYKKGVLFPKPDVKDEEIAALKARILKLEKIISDIKGLANI